MTACSASLPSSAFGRVCVQWCARACVRVWIMHVWVNCGVKMAATSASNIRLAVLVPSSGSWPEGRASVGAIALAVDEVNRRPDLLGGKQIEYIWREVECDAADSFAAISLMLEEGPVSAVVGPDCSLACESTAYLTAGRNIAQISYSCSSSELSKKTKYPTVCPRPAASAVLRKAHRAISDLWLVCSL